MKASSYFSSAIYFHQSFTKPTEKHNCIATRRTPPSIVCMGSITKCRICRNSFVNLPLVLNNYSLSSIYYQVYSIMSKRCVKVRVVCVGQPSLHISSWHVLQCRVVFRLVLSRYTNRSIHMVTRGCSPFVQ